MREQEVHEPGASSSHEASLLPAVENDGSVTPESDELTLKFCARASEYFRIWIVNVCLTLVTLGVFSAWAKVRRQRYFYGCTRLAGTPFEYTGRPIPILKGRLIAITLLGAWYALRNIYPFVTPFSLVAAVLVAPWVMAKSIAFRARATAFRTVTFSFDGSVGGLAKVIYGYAFITLITLGIAYPLLEQRTRDYVISHTSFGGKVGYFRADAGSFFGIYFKSTLLGAVSAVPIAVFFTLLDSAEAVSRVSLTSTYVVVLMMYTYRQARVFNLCWCNTFFGDVSFESTLKFRGMLGLYVTNVVGIALSAGLLIPWAMVRTARYRIEHMRVILEGDFEQFKATVAPDVHAVGAEAADVFDWDLAF